MIKKIKDLPGGTIFGIKKHIYVKASMRPGYYAIHMKTGFLVSFHNEPDVIIKVAKSHKLITEF